MTRRGNLTVPETNFGGEQLIAQAAANLPGLVVPMVNFATEHEPDKIIVCDRGARPIGVAFEAVARRMRREVLLGKMVYQHVSGRMDFEDMTAATEGVIDDTVRQAETPSLMVIDDYVSEKATTAHKFRRVIEQRLSQVAIHWVTLVGKGTDLNVRSGGVWRHAAWRDRPDIIGIDYQDGELIESGTDQSNQFYAAVEEAAQALVLSEAA